jgi:glutathione S-transferase
MIELYELAGADPSIRFSPFCWRIRMALAHKGLEARTIPWHFGEKKLPKGTEKVPVLVDDGEVIADSSAIAHHLEVAYDNGPSLFGGEGGEAHGRFVTAWANSVLQPGFFPLIVMDIFAQVKPEARAYFRSTRETRVGTTLEKAAEGREGKLPALHAMLSPLRLVLQESPFVGGEEPSFADYTAFGPFMQIRCLSEFEVLAEDDPVHAWRERMLDLFDGLARQAKTVFEQ